MSERIAPSKMIFAALLLAVAAIVLHTFLAQFRAG